MQSRADTGMSLERMPAVVSGAFASACVVFMAGFIALDPKSLDDPLRHGILLVCIALPILLLALYMSLFMKMGCLAYQIMFVGGALFQWGVKSLLDHVYPSAGSAFILSITGCEVVLIDLQWWRLHKLTEPRRRLRTREVTDEADSHAEPDHPTSSPLT